LRLSSLDGLNGGSGIRSTIFVVGFATMFKGVSQVRRVGRTSVVCIPTRCFRRAAAAAYSLSQTLHFIMVMFIGKQAVRRSNFSKKREFEIEGKLSLSRRWRNSCVGSDHLLLRSNVSAMESRSRENNILYRVTKS
jgi:hypothetical protein